MIYKVVIFYFLDQRLTDRGILTKSEILNIIDLSVGNGSSTVSQSISPDKVIKWDVITKTEADDVHKRHTKVNHNISSHFLYSHLFYYHYI